MKTIFSILIFLAAGLSGRSAVYFVLKNSCRHYDGGTIQVHYQSSVGTSGWYSEGYGGCEIGGSTMLWYGDGSGPSGNSWYTSGAPDWLTAAGFDTYQGGDDDQVIIIDQGCSPQSTTTNVCVTLSNPAGSGLIQTANWYFNGLVVSTETLCPGHGDTQCHTCSLVDPVDSFTGGLVPLVGSDTNVTGTVYNDQKDKIVQAYWNYNGQVVKQEYLAPFQQDSMTESIDLCAGNSSFTWGYTITGTTPNPNNPNNPFGNSTNVEGNLQETNGFNLGNGATGTVGGNPGFPTGTVLTNNIAWPTSSGQSGTNGGAIAHDATLEAGFGQLHQDEQNIIAGEGILNQDLQKLQLPAGASNVWVQNWPDPPTNWNYTPLLTTLATNSILSAQQSASYFTTYTNQLGQVVTLETVLSNEILQVVAAITNQATNQFTFTVPTNSFQFPTNLSVTFSNYATESTLEGISNLLGGSYAVTNAEDGGMGAALAGTVVSNVDFDGLTNDVELGGETNYAAAQSASATASTDLQGVESGLATFISEMTPLDIDDNFGDPDLTYTFNLGGAGAKTHVAHSSSLSGGSTTIDFNPLHNEQIAPFFTFSKTLWTWGLAMVYMLRCVRDATIAIEMCENARGVIVTSPTTKKTYS